MRAAGIFCWAKCGHRCSRFAKDGEPEYTDLGIFLILRIYLLTFFGVMSVVDEIRQLTNKQLLRDISFGAEGFQAGVYDLYLEEAKRRNLDYSDQSLSIVSEEFSKSKSSNEGRTLVILTVLFFGPFSFVPGLLLLKKDAEKKTLYKQGYRMVGLIGIFFSIVAWIAVASLFIRNS